MSSVAAGIIVAAFVGDHFQLRYFISSERILSIGDIWCSMNFKRNSYAYQLWYLLILSNDMYRSKTNGILVSSIPVWGGFLAIFNVVNIDQHRAEYWIELQRLYFQLSILWR